MSSSTPYNWAADNGFSKPAASSTPQQARPAGPQVPPSRPRPASGGSGGSGGSRTTHRQRTYNKSRVYNLNVGGVGGAANGNGGGNAGSGNGGGNGTAAGNGGSASGGGAAADRHQGDQLIHKIERIEFRSDKDILALAKAINHLGRELHLILGMRAEEVNGVLSTYKGKWYTFGASSRVKARLVSAHLKVSAEAAKALGVGALKMAHAFDRHFVKPEQEAKQQRRGQKTRPSFTIGD
ncbi:hypothetical protein [Streptomyces pinistramenti]|uniref:hypothetical protein n=1 Tax=Streptomyces pinistramenti TaxID=2884812 RepID=UPI001D07E6B6|nr:hypothetical protein [Streptomyces pinistramenti]MCB5910363.1 hypothetical protein [Streptomyces pinistramenti]